jgi:hypothetical protein
MDEVQQVILTAVSQWATTRGEGQPLSISIEHEEGDDPDRFIATIGLGDSWLALEIWLEDGAVVAIAELGEGVPPESEGAV